MSDNNNETQADIFAEMRGNEFDNPHAPKPGPNWKDICAKCNDGDIEPHFCRYYGEPNGCNSPIHGEHPATEKPAGNAAAMREALVEARKVIKAQGGYWAETTLPLIDAALAKPTRNCDVGTLTEQQQGFHDFCEKMQHTDKACCGGCPIVHLRMQGVINNSCELAWAQMPYEEEKA